MTFTKNKVALAALILSILLLTIMIFILNRVLYKAIMIYNSEHNKKFKTISLTKKNDEYEENNSFTVQNDEIIISHEARYSSFCKQSSSSKKENERNVLVIFNGLNSDYKNSIENRVKEFFNQEDNRFDEIIVLKYPKYSFSMEGIFYYNDKENSDSKAEYKIKQFFNYIIKGIRWILHKCFHYDGVIGHCETTLKNLLQDKKYNAANMSFFTYSAGGGIAARTIKRFKDNEVLPQNTKFHSVVHCNSFDKSYKVHANFFDEKSGDDRKTKIRNFIICKILKNIFIALMYIISLGYHTDAQDAYRSENFPVEKKGVFYSQGDEIINYDASLHNALSKESKEFLKERNILLYTVENLTNNIANDDRDSQNPMIAPSEAPNHCYIDFLQITAFYNNQTINNNTINDL